MKYVWILILLCPPLHAEVLNCGARSGAQFVADLGVLEARFKQEVGKKDFEELHRLVGEDPFFEIGLLLWPAYAEDILPYTEAFEECAGVAGDYIKSIPEKSSNARAFAKWRDCLQLMYKEKPSAAASELDTCFKTFHRK